MSTTFWLPSDTTAAVSPTPSGTDWAHINTVSRIMNSNRGSSAIVNTVYAPDAVDHLVDANAMVAQFVSGILPPQTIPAQVIGLGVRAIEALANDDLFLAWKLYAVNVAGDTVLATLLAVGRNAVEFATAMQGATSARTSTEAILAVNFRIVLEVGCGGLPTASGSTTDGHNCTIEFGETYVANGIISQSASGGGGAGNAKLEFANSLQLNALPAVGDVESGVTYGIPGSELTGTLVLPTEAQVEDGVSYGADGTEFTGTFEGSGGGTVILIRR